MSHSVPSIPLLKATTLALEAATTYSKGTKVAWAIHRAVWQGDHWSFLVVHDIPLDPNYFHINVWPDGTTDIDAPIM